MTAAQDVAGVIKPVPLDLASLERVKIDLVKPPFVHAHTQKAEGSPKIYEVTLTIEEKKIVLDDTGTEVHAMTFNGSVPGPMIVVHQDDYVELTLINLETNEFQHNIDFHAATGGLGGDAATHFFLLVHGRLKVTQVTSDGQQIIVRVVHPGDLFGFAKALRRSDYPGTAMGMTESLAVCWPTELWPAFIDRNPHLAVSALSTIGQRLEEAHTRIREMSTQDVERRVAHTVIRLSQQAGRTESGGIRIDFPISRQDIAEMTGTTLHTVSRILSAWEQLGLVKGGRQKLLIRDPAGLQALADNLGV